MANRIPTEEYFAIGDDLFVTSQLVVHYHGESGLRDFERWSITVTKLECSGETCWFPSDYQKWIELGMPGEYDESDSRVTKSEYAVRPKLKLFLSHATSDRLIVDEAREFLEQHDLIIWVGDKAIMPSASYERSILKGLETCDWLVLFMTPQSAKSEWVKDEVNWMVENKPHQIVPLLVEDCAPQEFHIRISRLQHIDCRIDLIAGLKQMLKTNLHHR